MNSIARFFCLAATGFSTIALAQPTPPRGSGLVDLRAARDATAPAATPDRFILHDVAFFADGEAMALITDRSRRRHDALFYRADFAPAGCLMKEITREHVLLVDRRDGREIELKVAGASAADPAALAQRTKEWLNSEKNPMFPGLVDPPHGIYDNWEHLSEGQKEEMAIFYANYGWRFRAQILAGTLDIAWERTNEADRIAAGEASRATFLGLLSAEQRQAWERMSSNPPLYPENGKWTEELKRIGDERRRVFTEFKATFTPEQQAAFDRMSSLPSPPAAPRATTPKSDFVLPQLLPVMPTDPSAPPRYSKAWINSHANPMLDHPEGHAELTARWSGLTTAEKTQVLEYFQKHGWQAQYLITTSGLTSQLSWGNIYGEERAAVSKAKYDAFSASLSAEQQRVWYARNRNPPPQQAVFDAFLASLTATQQAAYADLHDFTKADWK